MNGLKNAAAKPAAAPRKGIETPTIESYPRESASGTQMRTNGMTSSAMPKIDPPSEKIVMRAGIISFARCGLDARDAVIFRMPSVMMPVAWMTLNEPPIRRRNAMMSEPSRNPRIGAMRSHWGPRTTFATLRYVPGTVT